MLALALGGKTVAELQASMPQSEFEAWIEFYRLFPFDDFHRFHRPAALVAGALGGGDMKARLEWLQPDSVNDGLTDADMTTLKTFGFSRKGG